MLGIIIHKPNISRYTMNMQTIQLDISSDIFDKMIAFFEIFPKDKIQIIYPESSIKYQ